MLADDAASRVIVGVDTHKQVHVAAATTAMGRHPCLQTRPSQPIGGSPMTENSDGGEAVSFQSQIKPMFREKDQQSMSSRFDLWSYDSVSDHADAIYAQVRSGTMPCDGAWPQSQVDLFERWIDGGKLP